MNCDASGGSRHLGDLPHDFRRRVDQFHQQHHPFASDRQRLETIQRIGRALRRNSADPAKRLENIDFVWANSDATWSVTTGSMRLGTVLRTTT